MKAAHRIVSQGKATILKNRMVAFSVRQEHPFYQEIYTFLLFLGNSAEAQKLSLYITFW